MALGGIESIAGVASGLSAVPTVADRISVPGAPESTDGASGFATRMADAVDELQGLQKESDSLKVAAVTGDLNDIHASMIASSRAAVTLELVAAVRNKGVDAFNEIMRMQA
ncbi:flagellar hook-basal body complex protein FliE [Microbacterium sp. CIAB417]|uniref:flagellar hook-basal body complex protein FliE n=1 Tax=Microbacterium sp. CIAB417 TaxID=2860287 RepID=UPI0035ABEC30